MHWLLETILGLVKLVVYVLWAPVSWIRSVFQKYTLPDLSANVCVVTGGGGGLGRELALKFAECGASIALWDVDEESMKSVANEIRGRGGEVYCYVCDCSNPGEVQRTAESVREELGNVAILINNAGIVNGKPLLESSEEEIQKVMEVNALGYMWTTKAFLPWMVENNYGYIISVASVLAFTGVSGLTDYCSSKAAVLNFTESLRCELIGLKKNGITVTCVCPYHVDTEMFAGVRTRFPGILKTLKPSAVADRTVKAVVRRDALVIMPSYFRLLIILKWILPVKAFDELLNLTGANDAMKSFIGRHKRE